MEIDIEYEVGKWYIIKPGKYSDDLVKARFEERVSGRAYNGAFMYYRDANPWHSIEYVPLNQILNETDDPRWITRFPKWVESLFEK